MDQKSENPPNLCTKEPSWLLILVSFICLRWVFRRSSSCRCCPTGRILACWWAGAGATSSQEPPWRRSRPQAPRPARNRRPRGRSWKPQRGEETSAVCRGSRSGRGVGQRRFWKRGRSICCGWWGSGCTTNRPSAQKKGREFLFFEFVLIFFLDV